MFERTQKNDCFGCGDRIWPWQRRESVFTEFPQHVCHHRCALTFRRCAGANASLILKRPRKVIGITYPGTGSARA